MKRLTSILAILVLVSCNPLKKVLNDPGMFNQVAEQVIRRGLCVNDTTVITETKDSIVYKDSIIERISSIPCKDFDTTIGRARIKVSSGVLTYSAKDSIVVRKQTITHSVRDRSYERILQKDIASLDSVVTSRDKAVPGLQTENKELKADLSWWKFRLFFLLAVIVAWNVGKTWIRSYLSKL